MILVNFPAGINEITIPPLTQWDYGQTLKISGLTLPEIVQVHFCDKSCEKAIVRLAEHTDDNCCVVTIPDELLKNPYGINVFIYVIETNQAETVRIIHIPIIKRTQPADYIDPAVPTTQNKLEELIADVADLTNDFARVYGADGKPLSIEICDTKPSVQNANTLYIYPDVAIESRVAALESKTSATDADVATLEGRATVIENDITAVEEDVEKLKYDINHVPVFADYEINYLDDSTWEPGTYQVYAQYQEDLSGHSHNIIYNLGLITVHKPTSNASYTEYSTPNQGYYLKIENQVVSLYMARGGCYAGRASYLTEDEALANSVDTYGVMKVESNGSDWRLYYRKIV